MYRWQRFSPTLHQDGRSLENALQDVHVGGGSQEQHSERLGKSRSKKGPKNSELEKLPGLEEVTPASEMMKCEALNGGKLGGQGHQSLASLSSDRVGLQLPDVALKHNAPPGTHMAGFPEASVSLS